MYMYHILPQKPIFISYLHLNVKKNYVTHLSRMKFPTVINWNSPFQYEGFYFIFIQILKQTVENLIRRHCGVWSGFALFADVLQKVR